MNCELITAIVAALKAGREIMEIYEDPASDFHIERKKDNSPLTIADKKAHRVIAEELKRFSYPVLSEEGEHLPYEIRKGWTSLWIVDPLDGTKEFIRRNGEFTVNIALVKEGVPVMGVIYAPVLKTLYFGAEGIGAYRCEHIASEAIYSLEDYIAKGERMPCSPEKSSFTIVASRSHLNKETQDYMDELEKEHGIVECISRGSSLKICMVAEGKADVYPRFAPTMEWDTAAGHAIVRAVGKEIYLQDEVTPLVYNKPDLLNPWFVVR